MKMRFSLLLISICCLPIAAMAQGACYPAGMVLLDTGRPANGASVSVCTAGGTFPGCTSTTSLFTTPALSVAASNPVTTDTHGNFGFCAAAGVNYDLQITGTGITPLTIKNLPLPPTSPITAAALTSSSANPANVGLVKLASGDCLDWRNNANSGNIQLCKTGAASGGIPADSFDMTAFGAAEAPFLIATDATGFVIGSLSGKTRIVHTTNGSGQLTFEFLTSGNGIDNILFGYAEVFELAAPGGIAGRAQLWADATSHFWKAINNNGTAYALVGDSTTQTLTNKTLTSPAITTPSMNGTTINGVPSVMQFSCTGTATAATTLSMSGGACTNTLAVLFPVSSTATIANLRCKSQAAGVNASSGAVTVRKNGVAQTTTCTIGTGTTCSDLTHTFSVAAGDTVDLVFTTQTAETIGNIGCTVEKQ